MLQMYRTGGLERVLYDRHVVQGETFIFNWPIFLPVIPPLGQGQLSSILEYFSSISESFKVAIEISNFKILLRLSIAHT